LRNNIVCPYCLAEDTIDKKKDKKGKNYYACSECNSTITREYVENTSASVEVVSAVGFRGHGKTLYFSSLFHSLDKLATIWPGFYSFATDEKSLDTIKENISKLKRGDLPPPNPASFPIPTNVRFSNMPSLGNKFFLFYDTGGEAYTRASKLIKYAGFVRRSNTVIFLVCLEDIDYNGLKMHELLSIYTQGMIELGGNPKDQHLLVVFSKGDLLGPRLTRWKQIRNYLAGGRMENLKNIRMSNYIMGMKIVSARLRRFAKKELNATQFINFAQDRFKSVDFSIISSLGAKPVENRLQVEMNPKRIFDPLLWVSFKSLGWLKRNMLFWRKQ
jgi:hypothetical protein